MDGSSHAEQALTHAVDLAEREHTALSPMKTVNRPTLAFRSIARGSAVGLGGGHPRFLVATDGGC